MPATVQERADMIDSISTTAKLFVQMHSAILGKGTAHKAQRRMTDVIKELVMTVNLGVAFIAVLWDIVYINVCVHVSAL